ncbi:MAG: AAA domain-containing protein [Erysipelotrichales bacterium]|nr:AAA domain-containing protein [Erysipelotrichales bacterium]
MKKIYKFYKERLIEISGRSRTLYAKRVSPRYAYDIGRIFEGNEEETESFVDFLWGSNKLSYPIINSKLKNRFVEVLKPAKDEIADIVSNQVMILKNLKREIEEFERETGRYELFVGYPFVEGSIGRDQLIKAPLLLFPVIINVLNDSNVEIELKQDEPVQLNKVFTTAYAKYFKLDIEELSLEFDNLDDSGLKGVRDVVNYLRNAGIKIENLGGKGLYGFNENEPKLGDSLEIKRYAVLGRYLLANSIYNDYNLLEQQNLSTDAIAELLENKPARRIKNPSDEVYAANQLDYAQECALQELNQHGNIVIYGPPGTGKSQTIVNIITDALCKNKRVLVVSQKKAALDVVFNRLGDLNNKAMYIVDAEKSKSLVYERVKQAHYEAIDIRASSEEENKRRFRDIARTLGFELGKLESISEALFTKTEFGLSLQEMYANSHPITKNSGEYILYEQMLDNQRIMDLDFQQLNGTITSLQEKRKPKLYYRHLELQKNNFMINHIHRDLDVHAVNSVKMYLEDLISKRLVPYDTSQYPNVRQLLGFYLENNIEDPKDLLPIISFIARLENPKLNKSFLKKNELSSTEEKILNDFIYTVDAVKSYIGEYYLLERILDRKGFAITIDNILNGNVLFLKLLLDALNEYEEIRDMKINLGELAETEMLLLNFAYENSESEEEFNSIVNNILPVRLYHEIVLTEESMRMHLSKIMDYENIKNRIVSLKSEQKNIVSRICQDAFRSNYKDLYNSDADNKNFFYQISKQSNFWPVRKLIDVYGDLLFNLYPCWLLSPESVSTLLPLKQNLFDLILFDEASQIFIESALPAIYRGRHIAVAGDNKQLRPNALFMRRFAANDLEEEDYNTQAALEVESLLDLATSRYESARLSYHYRSNNEELINFSNYAFYDCKLQVVPNLSRNIGNRPIERLKIDGRWLNRYNRDEAMKVVEVLKEILLRPNHQETVGIITFNSEQEGYIADLIEREARKDPEFQAALAKEHNRKIDGGDVSLFVKNLENVQGDERDIIIFSIAYAKNEHGKVISHFGPLNLEGGENRLNVAITRAKKKVYVVTSIEPEDLNVENTKHSGPKILKKYLQYVRAVSEGNRIEATSILDSFRENNLKNQNLNLMAKEIKLELEKIGYTVEASLGNNAYQLSLAIYDKDLDAYLLGIEYDYAAFEFSPSIIERDVYRSKFMESRGWKIIRIWSRDWWQSKAKVITQIDELAKLQRQKLSEESRKTKVKKVA